MLKNCKILYNKNKYILTNFQIYYNQIAKYLKKKLKNLIMVDSCLFGFFGLQIFIK